MGGHIQRLIDTVHSPRVPHLVRHCSTDARIMPSHLPPVRASPMGRFDRPFRYQYQQRRTFLGLRRPPPPKTPMMGYLVAQGLAVVLLADLGIAMLRGEPTTVRSVCQSAGFWKDPDFKRLHEENRKTLG